LTRGLDSIPLEIRVILRLSLYQLLFLDNIPQRAAVDQGVELARWTGFEGLTPLVNGVLRNIQRESLEVEFPDRENAPARFLSVFYSHPQWLVRRWLERFGFNETEELLAADNARPVIMGRVNTTKTTARELVKRLAEEGVETRPSRHCGVSVELKVTTRLPGLASFRTGDFTIQDTSSTLVGMIPQVDRSTKILDLCAAPGGKCTHAAERGMNEGMVLAVDSSLERIQLLVENRTRLGLDSITCVVADGRNFEAGKFHLVLVDAPCTGTGVLSRRADLRWRLRERDLKALQRLQSDLLGNAATLVKKGGNLLYSTCSLEPEENEAVVERFLRENRAFERGSVIGVPSLFLGGYGCFETFPHKHSMDGMFACLLTRG
jgi:16S rRNA (cytosine967-C5)-methyltransferase